MGIAQLTRCVVAVAASCAAGGALAAPASAIETLVQKPGVAGCVSGNAFGQCAHGRGLGDARSTATSPDGANVYVASDAGDALAVFDRAANGTLTQKAGSAGCISDAGAGGCADGVALTGLQGIAISPDGRSVYVTSYRAHAVAVFDRAGDGTLQQKAGTAGCVTDLATALCAAGHDLGSLHALALSADGQSLYATSIVDSRVAVFDRAADGTLTQKPGAAGCFSAAAGATCAVGRALNAASGVAVSPDDRSVYVSSMSNNGVAVFDRASDGALTQKAGTAGCVSQDLAGCAFGKALGAPSGVTSSPDGATVYVSAGASAGVAVFDRAADGTLTQKPGAAGCVSSLATGGACGAGTMLNGATSVTVSPDGASAYVTAAPMINFLVLDGALAVFDRAADGTLTQKPGQAGCVYEGVESASCVKGRGIIRASAVSISPSNTSAYVTGPDSNAVAIFDKGTFVAPPPPPPPPPAVPDRTRPVLSRLALKPVRFRAAKRGPSVAARGGSTVTYRLSEVAPLVVGVQRALAGRRVGGRCVAATRSNRRAKRCDRYRSLAGDFVVSGFPGRNAFRFSGRLGRRALAAGRYRLRAVARDSAGNVSRPAYARFEIGKR